MPLIGLLKDYVSDVEDDPADAAAEALGKLKDARAVEPLIAALKMESTYAAEALGRIRDRRAVKPLTAALKSSDRWFRLKVAMALTGMGSVNGITTLIENLKAEGEASRSNAAGALASVSDERASKALTAALQRGDVDVAAGGYQFFIRKGIPGSEAILVKALERYGSESMALDYIGSGNDVLADAGRKWRDRYARKSSVAPGEAHAGPKWGGK